MDRLAESCLRILNRMQPARTTLDALEDRLRRDRIAVTRSVLSRSLRVAEGVLRVNPWRGPNGGLPRAESGMWVVLAPGAGGEPTVPVAPRPGDRWWDDGSRDVGVPVGGGPGHLDRAIRTLASAGDMDSPCALARWVRICDEGTGMTARLLGVEVPGAAESAESGAAELADAATAPVRRKAA